MTRYWMAVTSGACAAGAAARVTGDGVMTLAVGFAVFCGLLALIAKQDEDRA